MRDTFIFYRSFKESMSDLSDKDKLIMYEAISDYSLDLKEPKLTGFPKALFSLIRPILDANIQRWKNGRKGGAPIGNLNAKKQPRNDRKTTEKQPNKDVNKDVNKDKEYNIENANIETKVSNGADKSTRFVPPSLIDVQEYIQKNNYSVDALTFIDFYTSKGWMVGSNKMKDWKAAVRTWQRKYRNTGNTSDIGVILKDNSPDKYKKGW
jgi:hypothetical protein